MADSIRFDMSEVRALSVDLSRASMRVQGDVVPLVFRGAMAIKAQMRAEMGGSRFFHQIAGAIDFDIKDTATTVEAEIGPDKGKVYGGGKYHLPGPLGNIAYFGNSRGGGTVADPQGALDVEAPKLERAIDNLMGRLL